MKSTAQNFRNQQKQTLPNKKRPVEPKLHLDKSFNQKRWKIVESINAGHVRGGHSFH
jgi:hypothetical protein